MFRLLTLPLMLLQAVPALAQEPPSPPTKVDSTYDPCCDPNLGFIDCFESKPEPAIGLDSLWAFIGQVVKNDYPAEALRDGVEGRVIVTFVVAEDGSAHSFEVSRGVRADVDSVAVNAVRNVLWEAGYLPCRNEPIALKMALPITFRLPRANTN